MKRHWTLHPGSVAISKKPDCEKQSDGTFVVTYHFTHRSDQGLGFDWFEADAIGDSCCAKLAEIKERWGR